MAIDTKICDRFALYNADCIEVLSSLPSAFLHLSIYSPPFATEGGGLYNYSSSEADLSNCRSYDQFFSHYEFVVRQMARITMPGRMSCVHSMDIPGKGRLIDFPGDIIRLHEKHGFRFHARFAIWKEPLRVAMRTRSLGLRHSQLVKDATVCNNAGADYLLVFRKEGENPVPVEHRVGLTRYAGARAVPDSFECADGKTRSAAAFHPSVWKDAKTNKLAHWIWQQYASSVWGDIRIERVLPYRAARDKDDEKHVHPLQLDVIERCVELYSNIGETVLSPFAGVGSEVCGAIANERNGVGIELKPSYFRQAVKNTEHVLLNGLGDESGQSDMRADFLEETGSDDGEEFAPDGSPASGRETSFSETSQTSIFDIDGVGGEKLF